MFFSGERGFIEQDDLVIFKTLKNRVLRWGIGEKFSQFVNDFIKKKAQYEDHSFVNYKKAKSWQKDSQEE